MKNATSSVIKHIPQFFAPFGAAVDRLLTVADRCFAAI
jgi:hypothetical protein